MDPTGRDDEDTITLSQSELDKINTLHPEIREDVKTMLLNLKKEGVDVELTLTTRTYEESMIKMAKKTGIKILMICKFMDKNIGLYVSDSLNIPFERYNHFDSVKYSSQFRF